MKNKNVIASFVIVAAIILIGVIYLRDKPVEDQDRGTYTVSLQNFPMEFDLPKGYGVYVSTFGEGGFGQTVEVGKISRDGYLVEAIPTIRIMNSVYVNNKEYKPSEYVDFLLPSSGPKNLKLFGNQAARIVADSDGYPTIYGYLRSDQIMIENFYGKEGFLVSVSGSTYGSSKEFKQELLDLVLNSLRIKK